MKKTMFFWLIFAVFAAACQSAATDQKTDAVSDAAVKSISVDAAKRAVEDENVQFIDVRTVEEYAGGHAPKAVNLPLDTLTGNVGGLDKNKPVYVICETGRRSRKGAEILQKNGFRELYNIEGGTVAWTAAGFPIEK
jgi:rhodanese-related sulfurtransferase